MENHNKQGNYYKNEDGYALIIVMLVITLLLIVSVSLIGVAFNHSQQITHEQYRVQATNVAEMGMKNFSANLSSQLTDLGNQLNNGQITVSDTSNNDANNPLSLPGKIATTIQSIATGLNNSSTLSGLQNNPTSSVSVVPVAPSTMAGLSSTDLPFKVVSTGTVNGVIRQVSQTIVVNYAKKTTTTSGSSDGTGVTVPIDFSGSLTMGDSLNRYLKKNAVSTSDSSGTSSSQGQSQSAAIPPSVPNDPVSSPPSVPNDSVPSLPNYSKNLQQFFDQVNGFATLLMNNSLLRADNIYLDNQTARCSSPVLNSSIGSVLDSSVKNQFPSVNVAAPSSFNTALSGAANGSTPVTQSYPQDVNFSSKATVTKSSNFGGNVDVNGDLQFTPKVQSEIKGNLIVNGNLIIGSKTTVAFDGNVAVSGNILVLPGAKVTFGNSSSDTLYAGNNFWGMCGSAITVNGPAGLNQSLYSWPGASLIFNDSVGVGSNFFLYPTSTTTVKKNLSVSGDEYGWLGGQVTVGGNAYYGGSVYRAFLCGGGDMYSGYVYVGGSFNYSDYLAGINSSLFNRTVFVRQNAYVNEVTGVLTFTHGLVVAGNANLNGGERIVTNWFTVPLLRGSIVINPIHQQDNTSTNPVTTTTYTISLDAANSSPSYTYSTAPNSQ
ncbi:MAG: polymer-forming cytoskeletal protein [Sporolactobacillus sp.]